MRSVKIGTVNLLSDLSRWEERRDLLVSELAAANLDLLAVQEANLPGQVVPWLAAQLEMPYLSVVPKTGSWSTQEGIAILSRFTPIETADLDLQSQNRVAQRVQVMAGGQTLVIANTHLFWEPGESTGRLGQVERMLRWLDAIPGNPPVIVCGDFNGTPETAAIRRVREKYRSAYAQVHGHEPAYTTPTGLPVSKWVLLKTGLAFFRRLKLREIKPGWRGVLDYIFVDPRLAVLDCQVILDRPAPEKPRLYPSDHFGLAAVVQIGD